MTGPHLLGNRIAWVVALVVALLGTLAHGQPMSEDSLEANRAAEEMARPLIEREPYDLLTIRSGQELKTLQIRPLIGADGGSLEITEADRRLTIELIEHPGRQFALASRHVARHQTFPELLLEDAQRQLEQKNFDLVFRYLQRLREEYRDFPGTAPLLEELLVQNAAEHFQAGALAEALGMLEEARRQNPRRPDLEQSIQNVAQRSIQRHVDQADWAAARALVARFEKDGPHLEELVSSWKQEFTTLAETRLAEARQLIEANNLRDALERTREALDIDPQLSSAREQLRVLVQQYPLVRIATLAAGKPRPPHGTLTWSGRRNKRLLYRDLCEIVGYGPEGGQYISPFGTVLRRIDGLEVSILLRDRLTPVTGFHLSRQLTEDAASDHPRLTSLTRLVERLSVSNIRQLDIGFHMPHVRPEALLAFVPHATSFPESPPQNGAYRLLPDDNFQVYLLKDSSHKVHGSSPREIRFQSYHTTRDALESLRQGRVDLIDRLHPAVAAQLSKETPEDLVVDHYPAPVLHVLVPNLDNPYLRHRDFRRGVLYGIHRQEILRSALLAGQQLNGCRVISGPVPLGVSPDDPVSYGYDLTLAPREYEPQMSVALREMAAIELHENAIGGDDVEADPFPPLKTLILGHPDSEVSRQVCLAIVQDLARVGLPCELKVVDPEATRPAEVNVDLLYVEIHVAEPLTDIPRIFDTYVSGRDQPHYLQLALRKLRESKSWPEVRQSLWALHRLAHDDLLILPLFQLRDYFAYHRSLKGVGHQPMTLFQEVETWEVEPSLEVTPDAATP